jgi:DNA-binding IclR family transcriptional regulator
MVRKIMAVLATFSPERRELGMLEIAELLRWPKSTTSRILTRMATAGLLDRDPVSARYRIGILMAHLGQLARKSSSLQRQTRAALEELMVTTGETASLAVLSGRLGVDIEVVECGRSVQHSDWVGRHFPLHATAAGKTLLAWRPWTATRALLAAQLPRHTPATITDFRVLQKHLAEVRARGYSTAYAELEIDLAAIAAPVRGHTGEIIAAIAIGVPISRAPRALLPRLAKQVQAAGRSASRALGYSE